MRRCPGTGQSRFLARGLAIGMAIAIHVVSTWTDTLPRPERGRIGSPGATGRMMQSERWVRGSRLMPEGGRSLPLWNGVWREGTRGHVGPGVGFPLRVFESEGREEGFCQQLGS